GFAYWPAKRPTRTTGNLSPCTSTKLICNNTLSRFEINGEVQSAKLSAQSPPCNRKLRPSAASASLRLSSRTSHEVTSGGNSRNRASALVKASASGYTGCCTADLRCHESGAQSRGSRTA